MPAWIPIPGWLDVIDIALVTLFGWLAIGYLRRTGARSALAGLAMLGAIYIVARSVDLRLTAALFQAFFAVVVLVIVVVFQDDLRRLFERLGSWWRGRAKTAPGNETLDLVVRAVSRLASTRTGALIILPGREPLERHLEGGIALGGRVSEPLLLSLFDSSSPGHDGAVVLRGPIVERFAVHLPLSSNREALGARGTRHAAALGLAERCDAICIAVSEERGTVSVARGGAMRTLARPADLMLELRDAIREDTLSESWWRQRLSWDAALAAAGALALWMVMVPGGDMVEATVEARVEVMNLPGNLDLESIEPGVVDVTLRGRRRDLLLAQRDEIDVQIDALLARLGRRTFRLSESDVQVPDSVTVVNIEPAKVRLSVKSMAEDESGR